VKRCKHGNADHHQHVRNGVIVAEWLQCIDCDAVVGIEVMDTQRRADNYARPKGVRR
jgi:hypothetical protein